MIFTDSKGRSIEIKDGFLCIEAYDDGTKIGCIEFDEIEVSDYQYFTRLSSMNVEDSYQKAGIGIEMMRLAAEIYGSDFKKPSFLDIGGSQAASHTYYTQDGAALIRKCIALGILQDTKDKEFNDNKYDD